MNPIAVAGTALAVLQYVNDTMGAGLALLENARRASAILVKVQAEGRANLTPEEWAELRAIDAEKAAALEAEAARQEADAAAPGTPT